jgi:hypothetical protein
VDRLEQGRVAQPRQLAGQADVLGDDVLGVLPVAEVPGDVTQPRRQAAGDQGGPGEEPGLAAAQDEAGGGALVAEDTVIPDEHGVAVAGRAGVERAAVVGVRPAALQALRVQPLPDLGVVGVAGQPAGQRADVAGRHLPVHRAGGRAVRSRVAGVAGVGEDLDLAIGGYRAGGLGRRRP